MSDESPRREPAARPPEPSAPQQAAPPRAYDDEISLRELYLILKRGLPLIVITAVLAGAAAFAYMQLRPDVYESEATVVSNPVTVQLRGEGTIAFEPRSAIAFATYESLATSRATFERALAALDPADAEEVESFRAFRGSGEVERITGGDGTGGGTPLTVLHRVRWPDPALATRMADAWADATVEQVRETLLADLLTVQERTEQTLAERQRTLLDAERVFEAFLEEDLPGEEQRLEAFNQRINDTDRRLDDLDRDIAATRARRDALLAQTDDDAMPDAATLDLLQGANLLGDAAAAQLRLFAEDPAVATGLSGQATGLLARAGAQDAHATLTSLLAQRSVLDGTLEALEERADDARVRIAELRTRQSLLERELDEARDAYASVRTIEPALNFVADLTPGNTRILNQAQVPVEPSGTSATLIALIAATAAGIFATLFVFLREAIRGPERA